MTRINPVKLATFSAQIAVLALALATGCGSPVGHDAARPGDIGLSPTPLVFPRVAVGAADTVDLRITNYGDGALSFYDVELDEKNTGQFDNVSELELAHTEEELQMIRIAPEKARTLTIRYTPKNTNRDEALLRFGTTDPDEPEVEVEVLTVPAPSE